MSTPAVKEPARTPTRPVSSLGSQCSAKIDATSPCGARLDELNGRLMYESLQADESSPIGRRGVEHHLDLLPELAQVVEVDIDPVDEVREMVYAAADSQQFVVGEGWEAGSMSSICEAPVSMKR
ncbi:hypothetical protein [Streptomyces sp. MMBL 11-3]|uniref:hypothetical protein n=1 Tax=Streptomyces sp. MMBL 11-3 TaxID=3382639 RepID=UPI0039B55955